MDVGVGVADGVEAGDLAVAVALVAGVALVARLGVAVNCVGVRLNDGVALDVVAAGVADDVGAGVGVEEADAFDAGAMATI